MDLKEVRHKCNTCMHRYTWRGFGKSDAQKMTTNFISTYGPEISLKITKKVKKLWVVDARKQSGKSVTRSFVDKLVFTL